MKKTLSILIALMLVLSMGSFAMAEEETTLTVWFSVWVPGSERELSQDSWTITKIVQQFEADHPGVKVDMQYQTDQQVAQNKLRAAVLANDAPDIANVYGF